MPRFSIRNPYFIIVVCLAITLIGITSVMRMPVDLFPQINLPEVVVATFYSGMPPEDIEADITNRLERFFTLASGIDHMESRSLFGVSIIKIYFQSGTSADADVASISNLALADLRRLPRGTLPPVVLKFDAASLPVCLVTLKGQGLNESQLHDYGQFQIRNQIATVKGAEIPPPFGGKYRQIMVYVDPYKLASRQLSPMDVVQAVNDSNLILPAGDVKMGPFDYYIYSNSLVDDMNELSNIPLKTDGTSWVTINDVGEAKDAAQIQYNMVRVDGQRSVYLPIMKQGGDTNTIQVVNGVRTLLPKLFDIPKQLITNVVFDQSVFVKEAIKTLIHEGALGLLLTSIMILIFLGSFRATSAVFLSIPLSALATFIILYNTGSTLNTMILGGLALAFSRIIDNSVISLENIYRHLEGGASPNVAAEQGGTEVNMAVLAATLTTVVVFFPVTFLYGVSKFLFSALALAVAISLFASYVIAMTVIPLFCARYLKTIPSEAELPHREYEVEPTVAIDGSPWKRFTTAFNREFNRLLDYYEYWVKRALNRPGLTVAVLSGVFVLSLGIYPFLGLAFFPRTDAGQFTINLKAPTGTRIELTEKYVEKVEKLIKNVVGEKDLKMVVSNIGVAPGFSSMYTSNSGPYTATIQVALKDSHKLSSFEYMDRVQHKMEDQFPDLRAFFASGSMVDAILNMGMPAPIDVQVSGRHLGELESVAQNLAGNVRALHGVGQVYIPQDLDYPGLRLIVDRVHAGELGLTQKEVVDNVITALNSDYMIAPNYWLDRKSGNDYFLTVQYYEHGRSAIHNAIDLTNIPIRSPKLKQPTMLNTVAKLEPVESPTEIDHYQIQPTVDIYVTPKGEDLETVASGVRHLVTSMNIPSNVHVDLRGMVNGMNESFRSFSLGLLLSILLLYLILVAQFRSFIDPLLILLAIPMGLIGVLIVLPLTGTTLNVMSLMGVLMLVGIAASNSILIVEFAHRLEEQGKSVADAVITSCRVRLRPILMTSLATIIGMLPMAFKLGTGSEQYAPLARTIIGGLAVSVVLTVFIVPAAYLLVYGRRKPIANVTPEAAQ